MRAFHNTRLNEYRMPYGAVAKGETVTLALDVWDVHDAVVTLRTWTEADGEALREMKPVAPPRDAQPDAPTRYETKLACATAGIVWYHFIIQAPDGYTCRYGASQGCTGGPGALLDWEPPSFQLSVYDPHDAASLSDSSFNNTSYESFADALTAYLNGAANASALVEAIETFQESYPTAAWPQAFNVLSVPKREKLRLFLRLSGAPADAWPAEALGDSPLPQDGEFPDDPLATLSDHQQGVGKGRLWCASLIQALMPTLPPADPDMAEGNPSASDPYSAIAASWGAINADCQAIVENAADIRRALPLFEQGALKCFAANDDVFGLWRYEDDASAGAAPSACLLINPSLQNAHSVAVPLAAEAVSEVISGYGIPLASEDEVSNHALVPLPSDETDGVHAAGNQYACIHLNQLGSAIAYFHPRERLGKIFEPGIGVLAHITSIPVEDGKAGGCGTLGAPARAFVDWLASSNVRYWQVLPVNPTDGFGSPYAGISAFAGNTRLLEGGLADAPAFPKPKNTRAYQQFCKCESDWLEPYASFMAIRDKLGAGKTWQKWPKKYRTFNPEIIEGDKDLSSAAENWRRAQFAFEQQWHELRSYANERGVQIIGDMPIYVSGDSADVWANPELFQLDKAGNATAVAGCPPDSFAAEGQIWGNPVYNWKALEDSGYDWWMRRLRRAFELYDIVRLDHFIGFARYYSIHAGETALSGAYHAGPGLRLFNKAHDEFGPLPLIAEDLGLITPGVRTLVAACGFPGMDIVQFVDGNDPLSGYYPRPEKIAYTGTHDNQTLVSYCEQRYPELDPHEAAESLMNLVASCPADIRIFPLQDLMGLDDESRMNTPGTAEGNWTWQANQTALPKAQQTLHRLLA